jgi:hypothetical protein
MKSYDKLLEMEERDCMFEVVENVTGRYGYAVPLKGDRAKVYIGDIEGADDKIITAEEFNNEFTVYLIE